MKFCKYILFSAILFSCGTIGNGQTEIPKKSADSAAETAVYIPADRRHQGLSRYDTIPFTDRLKGDFDRYRAVNPKYVRREGGHYFYRLTVNSGTHFYDDNLKDQGVLTDSNVEIDVTQIRTTKSANGVDTKYFYAANKGYVNASAVIENAAEIRAGKWFAFPLKAGNTYLYDGTGIERGKIAARSVRLNYGLQKDIGGETYYYAFSTTIKIKNENVGASGWIKAAAIETGNDPQFDQTFVKKMQMPTAANDRFTPYRVTGGEPQEKIGVPAKGAAIYKFGYADRAGNFVAYKVLPKVSLDGNQNVAATDYLKRSDQVINLGFNPAGVSNDTFRIDGANRPLIFYRSAEKDATVAIDLFYPKDSDHSGEEIAGKMIFVYGYLALPNGKRWGWLPFSAIGIIEEKTNT